KARTNAVRLLGDSAEREADLGEALAAAANGIVTVEAKAAFDRAIVLDAGNLKGRFYAGLAAEQDGKPQEAAGIWRELFARAPAAAARRSLAAEPDKIRRIDALVKDLGLEG